MGVLKKLASETVIYGLSSIVGRFLNYLLVPFYTAVFMPEEYGIVTELYSYAAFLNVVFTYGMETTYFRHCNRAGSDTDKVFYEIQSMVLFSTLLLSLPVIIFSNNIAALLQHPGKGDLIVWLILTIAIDAILALNFARLRQEKKAKKFALIKITNILVNIGLNIFLLVISVQYLSHTFLSKDVRLVFVANFFANIFQIVFFGRYFTNWRWPRLNWQTVKPYLLYGMPLLVMGLAGMTNEVIDRIMLKFLLPNDFYTGKSALAAVGIYGACYKLSIFMSLGIQAFRYASEPFFFAKALDKDSPTLYAKVMHWFVWVCAGVLIFISLNLDWIQFVLRSPEYREGLVVVPLLLAANMFLGIYYNLSIWYKLTDKTQYGMYISLVGAVVTIGLNIALVPILGYVGSAWATLGCYLLMALGSYVFGQKHYPIPYDLTFVLATLLVSITASVTLWEYIPYSHKFTSIVLKNLLAMGLVSALFLLGKKLKTF